MKLQAAFLLICIIRTSFALPVQVAFLASNSNEILRLNGLTVAALGQTQASSLLPQYVLQQQQPEILFTPQVVNMNPQLAGPFGPQGPQLLFPNQGNQFPPVFVPNGQQEQPGPQQDPNNPNILQEAQNPMQIHPSLLYQLFRYPQFHRQQGMPYLPPYGYPQQRNTAVLQPNNGQQNLDRTTQRPQLPLQQGSKPKLPTDKTWLAGTQRESTTIPPDPRGDTTGPGNDEGNSNFPFLFEP